MPRPPKRATKKKSKKVVKVITNLGGKGKYHDASYHAKKFGHKAVDFAVDKVGSFIRNLLGSGEYVMPNYTVRRNVLTNLSEQIPTMHDNGTKSVTIRHREYLGDLVSSSTPGNFKIQKFDINPGDASSFPWLNNVCGQTYQKWRPKGIVYEFRTMSADALNSTNTALGSVIMATNYDSIEKAFQSKVQMEQTEFSGSCKPSQSMMHPIECEKNDNVLGQYFVTNGSEQGTYDPRLQNLGSFFIASVGMQGASVNLGEIWVTYDIDLIAPIQQPALSNAKSLRVALDVANVTTSALTGTSQSLKKYLINNLGAVLSGNTITIPRKNLQSLDQYMLNYCAIGAILTASVQGIALTYSGCLDGRTGLQNFTQQQIVIPGVALSSYVSANMGACFYVKSTSQEDGIITLSSVGGSPLPSALTSVDLQIVQIASSTLTDVQ